MTIHPYEPDALDDVAAFRAKTEPKAAHGWAAMELVSALRGLRESQGLSRAVAAVARLENRAWGVGFTRILAYAGAFGVEVGIVGELPRAA